MTTMQAASRHFAESVVYTLREAGYEAVFAGGCVRDLLLGQPPKDFDVATDARPEFVRNIFGPRRTLAVGESFGVVIVLPNRRDRAAGISAVEVATFRTEGDYQDGRHPGRVAFATAEEDAQRRDFTINGMFLDPFENRVLDYIGGFEDLHRGCVRAIGDPYARMGEDKLRMLRAIRFAATLDFELEPETSSAIRTMAHELVIVSAERIAQELRRMLVDPSRARAIALCRDHGLLAVIIPEVTRAFDAADDSGRGEPAATLASLDRLENPSFELAMAALLSVAEPIDEHARDTRPVVEEICGRLRLSNAATERIRWLLAHLGRLDEFQIMSLADRKRLAIHPGVAELVALERARGSADQASEGVDAFAAFLSETPAEVLNPPPVLTGGDLIRAGYAPGPDFGAWLTAVRTAQLNETVSTRDEALALIQRLQN